jgi:hypothetical protein
MTKKEHVNRNIGLTFDFIRAVVDHPETLEKIPNGSELDFIEKDLPLKLLSPAKRGRVARYKVERVFEPIRG